MPNLPVTEAAVEAAMREWSPNQPAARDPRHDHAVWSHRRERARSALSAALPHLLAGLTEDEAMVERVAQGLLTQDTWEEGLNEVLVGELEPDDQSHDRRRARAALRAAVGEERP